MHIFFIILVIIIICISVICFNEKCFAKERFTNRVKSKLKKEMKKETFLNNNLVEVSEGNKKFKVSAVGDEVGINDEKRAAKLMAQIDKNCQIILKYLKTHYPDDYRTKNFQKRYKTDALEEVSPFNKNGDTSFSINKGKKLGFCIRQKEKKQQFAKPHAIMFVVAHELAHIVSNGWGHGKEFEENFEWLLEISSDLQIYNPVIDYSKYPEPYCGIVLNSANPLLSKN